MARPSWSSNGSHGSINSEPTMDSNHLSQQINNIIGQLHGLFDDIGVPGHEREGREAELYAALSEACNSHVRQVSAEKKDLTAEAQKMITTIRQMEGALVDPVPQQQGPSDDVGLEVTFPLTRCIQGLKEKHAQIAKVHRERFEQVKKLVHALESYSSHLEPSFVKIALPPTGPNQSIPPSFDLSPSYVDRLDQEFTRVYEEYERRIETVKSTCEAIIQLWAELGTPQAQTDGAIVKYYRHAPEQLGLHEADIARLCARKEKLETEKKNRERRLRDLRDAVKTLWEKLDVKESERKAFLNANRGCGARQINAFDDELARLHDLKRQNLDLFVEDARCKLQQLWDALYFAEDEMLEFTPAFSDVYSDALLEAHEQEIIRLGTLKEQRAPVLALVEMHRTLVAERDELAAASQDASRLLIKGQKGEKRDPGKLLREEKMRKRITKELPRVTADLKKMLEQWEDDWGRPFYVHGDRYLDSIETADRHAPGPRAKTPANRSMPSTKANTGPKSAPPVSRSDSITSTTRVLAPSRTGAKTPTPAFNSLPIKRGQPPSQTTINTKGSPSRIPARAPLTNLKNAGNIHEKSDQEREKPELLRRGQAALTRAPPPKMRDLVPVPELDAPVPKGLYWAAKDIGSSIVRAVAPEEVDYDRPKQHSAEYEFVRPTSHHDFRDYPGTASLRYDSDGSCHQQFAQSLSHAQRTHPTTRQTSNQSSNSNSTVITGSENWETYESNSEPEPEDDDEVQATYYPKLRKPKTVDARQEDGYPRLAGSPQSKRLRGIPPAQQQQLMVDSDGNRIYSNSEWTDEDAAS